jgi:HK97 family phage major capsid protein
MDETKEAILAYYQRREAKRKPLRAVVAEQRDLLDYVKREGREYLTLSESHQWDKLNEKYDKLEEQHMDAIKPEIEDAWEKRDNRQTSTLDSNIRYHAPGTYKPVVSGPDSQEMADLWKFVQRGRTGLTDEERGRFETRALQMDIDSAGGFLVAPQEMSSRIVSKLMNIVTVRRHATILSVSNGQSLAAPALDNEPGTYDISWSGEVASAAEDSTADFDARLLSPNYLTRLLKVSNTLINRGGDSIVDFLISRMAYVFSIAEEYGFLQGDGTNQPLGVFTASASGINTGQDTTAASSTAITSDEIYDLIYSLKQQYRQNARFIMSRACLREVMQLKTGEGDYIWKSGIRGGQPETLAGFPVHESEYCPGFSSGNYVMIFGDFSHYWIADARANEVQILDELYSRTNQKGIIMRKETDGMPVLEEAFVRLALA